MDDRLSLHIKIAGSGPPLVFFHPLPGLYWQPFHDRLAERYTVHAPEHWTGSLRIPSAHRLQQDNTSGGAIAARQFRRISLQCSSSQSWITCLSRYISPPGGTGPKKSPETIWQRSATPASRSVSGRPEARRMCRKELPIGGVIDQDCRNHCSVAAHIYYDMEPGEVIIADEWPNNVAGELQHRAIEKLRYTRVVMRNNRRPASLYRMSNAWLAALHTLSKIAAGAPDYLIAEYSCRSMKGGRRGRSEWLPKNGESKQARPAFIDYPNADKSA